MYRSPVRVGAARRRQLAERLRPARERLARAITRAAGPITLVFLAAGSAWGAAVLAPRNLAMSIFAGVLAGAVVTAAGTWIVAPAVEKRNRRHALREEAILAMLEIVNRDLGAVADLLFLHGHLLADLNKAARAAATASLTLRTMSLRTGSQRVSRRVEDVIHLLGVASLAAATLAEKAPEAEPPDDGDGAHLTFSILMTVDRESEPALPSGQSGLEDRLRDELNTHLHLAATAVAQLRKELLSAGDFVDFAEEARRGRDRDSVGSQVLAARLVAEIFDSLADNEVAADLFGCKVLELRESLNYEDPLAAEIDSLLASAGPNGDSRARAVGRLALAGVAGSQDVRPLLRTWVRSEFLESWQG